jgi:hypothetical protein
MASPARPPLKLLLAAAGALLLGYVCAGIYVAGLDTSGPPANTSAVTFKGGNALGQRITGKSWTARYGKIVTNPDQTIVDVDDVTQGIIFKNGKPYLHVQAKHMTINTLTHDFAASGSIQIETAESSSLHRTFVTDTATWSDATQRLVLPHKCVIETGAELPLTVGSLNLDVRTGQVEVHDVAGGMRFK